MRFGPVKRRRLIYRVFSRASADRSELTKPHSRPEPKLDNLSRCENWTGYARKELRKSGPRRSDGGAAGRRQHRLRARAHRADRGSEAGAVLHHSGGADHCGPFRHRSHQDRRSAEPAVPLQFQGLQAIRGRDQALPGDRIRRAGRGRRQDAAGARQPREDP